MRYAGMEEKTFWRSTRLFIWFFSSPPATSLSFSKPFQVINEAEIWIDLLNVLNRLNMLKKLLY